MNITLDETVLTKYLSYGPCTVHSMKGYNATGASLYLQLHAKPVVIAGDVPLITGMECPTATWFDWFDENGWTLGDCSFAISTTQGTYTAPGAGGGVDLTIILSTATPACDEDGTDLVTVVGNLTTGVLQQVIWAQASGPNKLLRLDFKNNSGATAYPIISAVDSPTVINSAQTLLPSVANGATGTSFFGLNGLFPREQVTSAGAHVLRQGCTVAAAAAAPIGTALVAAGTPFNIRGVYLTAS